MRRSQLNGLIHSEQLTFVWDYLPEPTDDVGTLVSFSGDVVDVDAFLSREQSSEVE